MQKKLEFGALLLLVMGLLAACAAEPARVADSTNPLPTSGSTASVSPLPTNTLPAQVSPLPTSKLPAKLSPLPTSGAAASALPTTAVTSGDRTCVTGYVQGGGDTTPKDLRDAPRKFAFDVKSDAGQMVHVTYTAYPPSSKLEKAIRLVLYAGTVQVGDYMKACGTMDAATSTLKVATQGDSIETYPTKP